MRVSSRSVLLLLVPALALLAGCGGGGGGDDEDPFPNETVLATMRLNTALGTDAVPQQLMLCLGVNTLDNGVALTVATLDDGDLGATVPVRETDQPNPFRDLVTSLTDGVLSPLLLCVVPVGQAPICFNVDDVDDLDAIAARFANDLAGYEITGLRFDAEQVTFLSDPGPGLRITGNILVLGQPR